MAIGEIKPRINRRPDGTTYQTYQGEYRDCDGKRRFVSHEKKKEAQRLLREATNEVEAGTHAKGSITLGQVIDEYIYDLEKAARRGDISKAFVVSQRGTLRRVPDSLKGKKITDFKDSGLFQDAINTLRDRGYAIRSVIGVKRSLSAVFEFAKKPPRGYVVRNVLRDFPVKTGKPPKRKNIAEIDEASRVLEAARDRQKNESLNQYVNVYAILCFIIQTGSRPEEACGLQVTDIRRFDRPPPDRPNVWAEATIQHTNTFNDGFRKRTKNDEVRVVPLARFVVESMDGVERFWQAKRLATEEGRGMWEIGRLTRRYFETLDAPLELRQRGFMFINSLGLPYHSHSLVPLVSRLVLRAGLFQRDSEGRILIDKNGKPKPKITLYSFRHMVATHNANNLPTHIAAAFTGHNSNTYLKTYVHQTAGDRLLIAKSMDELETALTATKLQRGSPSD